MTVCRVFRWTCIHVILLLCAYVVTEQRLNSQLRMMKYIDRNMEMIPIGVALYSINKLHCARSCNEYSNCYSFNFNIRTNICTLGSWLLNRTTTLDPDDIIYTQGAVCDEWKQFRFVSYQNVSTCIWISDQQHDYPNAQKTCQEMNSNLYTLKVIEKLDMMMDAIKIKHPASETSQMSYWVGLNDIATDEVYRWEDDGTTFDMTSPYKEHLFYPGEPNAPQTEQCILYSSIYWHPLNDYFCDYSDYFVCEKIPYFPDN